MNYRTKNIYKACIKTIAIALVCLFTIDTISWAAPFEANRIIPSHKDMLAAWTSLQVLTDAGIENPFLARAEAIEGAKLLLEGKRLSDVHAFLNEQYKDQGERRVTFLDDVQIDKAVGMVTARFKVLGKDDIIFQVQYQNISEDSGSGREVDVITKLPPQLIVEGPDEQSLKETALLQYVQERSEAHAIADLTIARYDGKGEPLSLAVADEKIVRDAIRQRKTLQINLKELPYLANNVYTQTDSFLFAIASRITRLFTKTSQEETSTRTTVHEILKDAFRHGNKLDFNLPIFLYIELDEEESIKTINCFDTNSSRALSITEEREAEMLGGGDDGGRGILLIKTLGWQYERKEITTKSGKTATQVIITRANKASSERHKDGDVTLHITGLELFIGAALTIWTGLGIFFAISLLPIAIFLVKKIYESKKRVSLYSKSISPEPRGDIPASYRDSEVSAGELPLSEQEQAAAIKTFFKLLESLENLRITNWWYSYADLILKMFDKGLIFKERTKEVLVLALKDIETKDAMNNYVDLILDMLDKGIITQKDDPKLIAALEALQKRGSWKEYADLVLHMLDKGFITQEDDPRLSAASENMEGRGEWIIYAGLVLSKFSKGFMLRKQAKKEIKLSLKMIKKTGTRQYRYTSLIFKMLDKGFIDRERANTELEIILKDLKDTGLWYQYAELVLEMLNKGFIDGEQAKARLETALGRLKKLKLWYWYADLLLKMRDKGFIAPDAAKIELDTALKVLKKKTSHHEYADLVIKTFPASEVSFLAKERTIAQDIGAPFGYYLKTFELARIFKPTEETLARVREDAKGYIALITATNNRVLREEQRINLTNLQLYRMHGVANLQFISPKLTKELIHNHCQRGFLPLLEDDIKAASLLRPEYVVMLKRCMEALEARRPSATITPSFMVQIINFANANQHFEWGVDTFTRALDTNTQEGIILNLGRGLIKFLADSFGIEVNLDEAEPIEGILKDWNLGYLGAIVSASHRWSKEDAALFNLVIRTALEGKFHALLYPEEHPDVTFKTYSEDERGLIDKIRAYNENFIRQLERLGVNAEPWLHPENIASELTVKDTGYPRNWQVILKDFRRAFLDFEEWFSNYPLPKKDELEKKLQGAKKSCSGFNRLLTAEAPDITRYYNLLSQGRGLNKLYKFLDKVQHQYFSGEVVPPQVADLINVVQEIQDYVALEEKKPKPLRMRFWKRQVGRDCVIANQVRSCTRLEQNARAIFEYLLDLGTIYLILEDPDTGQEKGYVRFFLGLNKHEEPTIFTDSADGTANAGQYEPIPEAMRFIEEFAARCNIEHVVSRETDIISKVGDALTEDYYHHSNIYVPAHDSGVSPGPDPKASHFKALKLMGERNAVNVAKERAERRNLPKRVFEDEENNYDLEMVCTELSELAKGLGLSEGEIGALLHKAFSALGKQGIDTSRLKDKRILIALLEENSSQYLLEDCENNRFIGINRTFLKIVEEIAKTDPNLAKKIGSVLLVLGVAHELRHETGLEDEDTAFDVLLLHSLCQEFSVSISELREVLDKYIEENAEFTKLMGEEPDFARHSDRRKTMKTRERLENEKAGERYPVRTTNEAIQDIQQALRRAESWPFWKWLFRRFKLPWLEDMLYQSTRFWQRLMRRPNAPQVELLLYGSYADGRQTEGSDLDLTFTDSIGPDFWKLSKFYVEIENFLKSKRYPTKGFMSITRYNEETVVLLKRNGKFFIENKYVWFITADSARRVDLEDAVKKLDQLFDSAKAGRKRIAEPQIKRGLQYRIALSIGGTKIGVSGVRSDGTIFASEELRWRKKLGRKATAEEFLDAIVTLINNVQEKAGGIQPLGIGIAFGGPGEYERGIVFSKNVPLTKDFPLKTYLEARLELPVVIMHDAAAAIMGETSRYGTLTNTNDAMAVVIGTGISAGMKQGGRPWYGRGAVGEIGWSLWYHEGLKGPSYSYDGDLSYEGLIQGIQVHKEAGDISLEERLSGPYLAKRFMRFIADGLGNEEAGKYFTRSVEELTQDLDAKEVEAESFLLELLTIKARTPGLARDFLEANGRELGTALATFIAHHKDKLLTKRIVLVGGVGENLGKGISTEDEKDFWLEAVKNGLYEELQKIGVETPLASTIRNNTVRSNMAYEREFFAFTPQEYPHLPIHTVTNELLPRNERVVVFSPHPDDDVITMAATIKKLVEAGNKVTVAYLVTGEHAVRNDFPQAQKIYEGLKEIFLKAQGNRELTPTEDAELWRKTRTKVREEEARQAVKLLGDVKTEFLELPYYDTRPHFGDEDIRAVCELFERIQPQHFFYSAEEDPHGAHGIGQEVIRQAFARARLGQGVKIWGYRGAYEEWPLEEAEHLVIVPFDDEMMQVKINSIKTHASQLNPMFPGTDKREFYERVHSRNRMTGRLLQKLGYFPLVDAWYAEVFHISSPNEFLTSGIDKGASTTASFLTDLSKREEDNLTEENRDEEYLILHSARHLKNYPVNMYIDLSIIPKEQGQLEKNMETLALLIARNMASGLDVRYVLEGDSNDEVALGLVKDKLRQIPAFAGMTDELFRPHTDGKLIKVILKSLENVGKVGPVKDWEFIVGLKDDVTKEGVMIPNYSAAMAIGLAQGALRVIVENTPGEDPFKKFDVMDAKIKERLYERIKRIHERFQDPKVSDKFTMDSLKFMVIGCSKNKLDYAAMFALPPIVKDLVERINEFHRNIQLILQNV